MSPFAAMVFWTNKKGAGCMRSFSDCRELSRFLNGLRCEATVRNQQGEKIGAVEFAPDIHDDRRRKWAWYFDGEAASVGVPV